MPYDGQDVVAMHDYVRSSSSRLLPPPPPPPPPVITYPYTLWFLRLHRMDLSLRSAQPNATRMRDATSACRVAHDKKLLVKLIVEHCFERTLLFPFVVPLRPLLSPA